MTACNVLMPRFKRSMSLSALIIPLIMLSGCSSSSSVSSGSIDPAKIATAKGEVVYCPLPLLESVIYKMDQPLIDKFNAQNNGVTVKVKPFQYTGDLNYAYDASLDSKNSDCDIITPFYAMYKFAAKGQILDLSSYAATRQGDFFDSIMNALSLNGKIVAIPIRADAIMLYQRPAIFPNSAALATWQNLYSSSASHENFLYSAGGEGLTDHVLNLLYQAGGELISADGGKSAFRSEQAKAVLNLIVTGYRSGSIPAQASSFVNNTAGSELFAKDQKIGAFADWSASTFRIDALVPSNMGSYNMRALPSWKGREGKDPTGLIGSNFLAINSYSKNPNAALKLINYLSGPEAARERAVTIGTGPALKSAYSDPIVRKKLPYLETLYSSLMHGRARPNTAAYPEIDTAIITYTSQAMKAQITVDQAVDRIDQAINTALKKTI